MSHPQKQPALVWRVSSHTTGSDHGSNPTCVAAASNGAWRYIQDSNNPGPLLRMKPTEFGRILSRIKAGELDLRPLDRLCGRETAA